MQKTNQSNKQLQHLPPDEQDTRDAIRYRHTAAMVLSEHSSWRACVAPLDVRLGLVAGRITPVVAEVTGRLSADLPRQAALDHPACGASIENEGSSWTNGRVQPHGMRRGIATLGFVSKADFSRRPVSLRSVFFESRRDSTTVF